MGLPDIRCIKTDKYGNYHIMQYKNLGVDHPDNGYYCMICTYKELDKDWIDKDDMIESQLKRRVNYDKL